MEDYERASIKERDEIGRIEFAEKQKAMKTGCAMKSKGYTNEAIMELTELTKNEIDKR